MKLSILKKVLVYTENYESYNEEERMILEDALEGEIKQAIQI
jgi:hypothetical protein